MERIVLVDVKGTFDTKDAEKRHFTKEEEAEIQRMVNEGLSQFQAERYMLKISEEPIDTVIRAGEKVLVLTSSYWMAKPGDDPWLLVKNTNGVIGRVRQSKTKEA